MKRLPRIVSAEPVIHGVLKIFTYLQKPKNFNKVTVEEYGHSVGWINDKGEEIDFGSDNLRAKAEAQAKLHKLVADLHA
jgi:hypothetical protein